MPNPLRPDLVDVDGFSAARRDQLGAVSGAFEAYHAELYSFLRRATRDERAAEDRHQETFLRLTNEVDAGRTPDHVRGWLYRVASKVNGAWP